MNIYELVKEDMTTLGHMGSNPRTEYRKYFSTSKTAQDYAQADYGDTKITWKGNGICVSSGDLRYVMYDIFTKEVDEEYNG